MDPLMPVSGAAESSPGELLDAVTRALQTQDLDRAVALADRALDAGVETPLMLNLSAYGLEMRGDLNGALTKLARAMEIAPTDVSILTTTGNLLSKLGRDLEALAYFENALVLDARHAPAHHGRGVAQSMIGDAAAARVSHQLALELDPRHPDAWGALADLALADKNEAEARRFAERAIGLVPHQSSANMVLAQLEIRRGEVEAAERRLRQLLSTPLTPLHAAAVEQMLGETLDALKQPEEAFNAFLRANALLRRIYTPAFEADSIQTGLQLARRAGAFLQTSSRGDWRPAGGDTSTPPRTHVFLLGFVRSGTTLLEQVLASHPDVVALEEAPTLRAIATPFFQEDIDGLEKLRDLTDQQADTLRHDYWTRVRNLGVEPDGKVFVDKEPMATLWLPMITKLFPDAKVILSIRDPRDVVVSAFKHRLRINKLGWSFTDLEETAEFYASVMDLSATYREMLPLTLYQHRHEDLVTSFDEEVSRICDFLEIEHTASMRDFVETAKRRDIRTPSAEQVRQGLFTEGMGRWRRYGPKTEAIVPIIQRWIDAYGYGEGTVTEENLRPRASR
jgi:tetratricopeptide (TPR) repeat protein